MGTMLDVIGLIATFSVILMLVGMLRLADSQSNTRVRVPVRSERETPHR